MPGQFFCFPRQETSVSSSLQMDSVAKVNMLILGVWGKTLMKCRAAAIAALLCTIFAGSNAEARGPYGSISVGNWQGGAYTNDQTGSFTHCAAGARYASGVFFLVMIDHNGGWSLGFMHEQWKLTTGRGVSADPDIRWPATVQRSRRSDRRQAGSRSDAEQFLAHRPISKGEGDDGLYARPALPVQPRSDRAAIAGIGALRGQGQAIRRGQRRRFLGPARRQAGRRGGGAGSRRRPSPTSCSTRTAPASW